MNRAPPIQCLSLVLPRFLLLFVKPVRDRFLRVFAFFESAKLTGILTIIVESVVPAVSRLGTNIFDSYTAVMAALISPFAGLNYERLQYSHLLSVGIRGNVVTRTGIIIPTR